MDGQRMDQITRALARGVTRRSAVKGIAVALGLSAAGVVTNAPAAARQWCACTYACGEAGAAGFINLCKGRCRAKLRHRHGLVPCFLDKSTCGFTSEDICYDSFP